MKEIEKISVITVNYNNKTGLEKTILSVLNQSYENIEYIIIDGGSVDNSTEVIQQYAEHISFWVSEPDNGVYHAMNKGILKSSGSYIFFLNSGDEFYDGLVLETLAKSNADIIYGNVLCVDNKKKSLVKYPEKLRARFFFYTTICHQALLIKRSCFDQIGLYDDSLKIVADWKFLILALCKYNFSYQAVNIIVSYFYLGGISSNKDNIDLLFSEREKVLAEEFPLFVEDYRLHSKIILYKYRLRYLNPVNILTRIMKM